MPDLDKNLPSYEQQEIIKQNTQEILNQFPISGGTDFLSGQYVQKLTSTHLSTTALEISGSGILLNFRQGGSSNMMRVQVDGGSINEMVFQVNQTQFCLIPFKQSLKITMYDAASVAGVNFGYLLL